MGRSVVDAAGAALAERDVDAKLAAARALRLDRERGALELAPPVPIDRPGAPERPMVVNPRDAPRRPGGHGGRSGGAGTASG